MKKQETGNNRLDFAITGRSLIMYALPTILSNIFMNIYGIVDSLFVSNIVGTDGLSALNIVTPMLMITMAIGSMIAMGGSALCAKMIGEGDHDRARRTFTFLFLFAEAVCLILCIIGLAFRRPLLYLMGADDALYPLCEAYLVPLFVILPTAMGSVIYSAFFVACGNPRFGFIIAIAGGVFNMFFDWFLLAVIRMGIAGAAIASGIGYSFQSLIGTIYFAVNRSGLIYFKKPRWDTRSLLKALSNGMSEMVTSLSSSVTMIAMNVILMKISGSDGVAAAAIVLSVQTILSAGFFGYCSGCAPIISFNYGKQDTGRLKRIFRVMLKTIGVIAVATCVLSVVLAKPTALIYASGEPDVVRMTVQGILVFTPAFLLMGYNMYASSLFTALNDGKTSAIVSFFRIFVFLILPLVTLPWILGVWGVWLSLPIAEALSMILTVYYFIKKKDIYHYA